MKDAAGNELSVGDRIMFVLNGRSSGHLVWGEVQRFTPKKVVVEFTESWAKQPTTTTLFPTSVVLPKE